MSRLADPAVPESEAAVLGSLLIGADPVGVLARLHPEDFHRSAHRTVWEAVGKVVEQGNRADHMRVFDQLQRDGRLADIGGAVALVDLVGQASTHDLDWHVGRVAEAAHRRRALHAARQFAVEVTDPATDVAAAIDRHVDRVTGERVGDDGITTADQAWPDVERLVAQGLPRGMETGWPGVDALYAVLPGVLTVVTGIPGHGKTQWMTCLAINLALAGWVMAAFAPESGPRELWYHRLAWTLTGRQPTPSLLDQRTLGEARSFLNRHFLWLDDDDTSLDGIIARARWAKRQRGAQGLIVDPWNQISHGYGRDRQDLYIQHSLARLVRLARREALHVWVVAHPHKMRETDGVYDVPTASNISGGAEWFNIADIIISLWRDRGGINRAPDIVDVHVQKVRYEGWHGRPGRTQLRYVPSQARYVDV